MSAPETQNEPCRSKLRVLFLEDEARDAKLAGRQLEQSGFELTADVVALQEEFLAAMQANTYDIVLADYRLPGWSGMDALEILRREGNDIPFILFTGTVGEETAVECIKKGATDYVLKDRPARLPHAVRRALHDQSMRAERRRAERSRDLLASIVQSSDDAIIGMALDGSIVSWNRGAEGIYGYSAAETKGQPISMLFDPGRADEFRTTIQTLRHGESIDRYETAGIRKDRAVIDVAVTMSAIREEHHISGISAIVRDITQQKRLQEDFLSAQKMEAVGLLAAGIAHDFNNLMTVVTGYSSLALNKLGTNEPLYTEIQEINKAGERAASLTRQLLAFSRKQVMQTKLMNLNDIVAEMDRLLRRLIGEDIDLMITFDAALRSIKADPGQIEQVIMNLAVNARDAMPKGGQLSIQTANCVLENDDDARVLLVLTDTGAGMDDKTQARIFEPFFTTKGVGKGTGLGLATVYGIVEQSGGRIVVESRPGCGSTFKIYFPAVEGTSHLTVPAPMVEHFEGSATLLVVEDEDSVRRLVCGVLEQRGYTVLMATDGREALNLCQNYPDTIDLLITDMVMPAMNGTELADKLSTTRPDIKVLFISGYSDDAIANHGLLAPDTLFLQKPFSPDALTRKVREMLDSKQ